MKDKVNYFSSTTFIVSATIFLIILESCAPSKPSLKKLSTTEPETVVSKQDSLLALSKERRPEFVAILSIAHINIARKAESSGNRETALKEYKKVLAIDPQNKTARYELLLLEGLTLYKKGSKPALWDAIEIFSKASMINQEDGVACYWIAKSYEKKDNKDLDKIIDGIEIVKKDLISIFKKNEIEQIECLNKKFDPNFHQAMLELEDNTVEAGLVVQEIQKGYMMKDRLLRPSLVGVTKKRDKSAEKTENKKENK